MNSLKLEQMNDTDIKDLRNKLSTLLELTQDELLKDEEILGLLDNLILCRLEKLLKNPDDLINNKLIRLVNSNVLDRIEVLECNICENTSNIADALVQIEELKFKLCSLVNRLTGIGTGII